MVLATSSLSLSHSFVSSHVPQLPRAPSMAPESSDDEGEIGRQLQLEDRGATGDASAA